MSVPEVNSVTRRQGRAELDEHALGVNGAEIDVTFKLGERPREEFMLDVRKKMAGISGVNITVGSNWICNSQTCSFHPAVFYPK